MSEPSPREAEPAIARHAASLIVWRGDAAGPEILMGLRGAHHRFMPNRLVFPGGSVDAADGIAAAATEPRPEVIRCLLAAADPALARALAVAAARELEEETGLSLGRPPALDGLDYLCRAVTPASYPVRFNARFLVVQADRAHGTIAGSGELGGLRWYGLEEALALELALVTRRVLERLREWLAMSVGQRRTRLNTPVFLERSWSEECWTR